uniref:V-type proton ATPase subunit G n=1 Tax=Bactrocera latifrons TaxID=174628 RepID=A0A0K8U4F5_BACLA
MKASQTPLPHLIHAEKQAAEIIYEARKRKNLLMRKCKNAASKEVAMLGSEREEVLKEITKRVNESLAITQRRVENTTKEKIAKIDEEVAKNRDKVVNMLLELMYKFTPEVHKNYRYSEDKDDEHLK